LQLLREHNVFISGVIEEREVFREFDVFEGFSDLQYIETAELESLLQKELRELLIENCNGCNHPLYK